MLQSTDPTALQGLIAGGLKKDKTGSATESATGLVPICNQSFGHCVDPRLQGIIGHVVRNNAQFPQASMSCD